jgi:2-polyprenyl-6-methoxyphenol hydroxylase-like FAD-dependent oxidoreductase
MAIEDAYVLAGLLSRPECNRDNIEAFLDAYEEVRRPRSYKQLLHACETGEVSRNLEREKRRVSRLSSIAPSTVQMFEWASERWGSDCDAIASEMSSRSDWIWDYDVRDGLAEAVERLKDK